MTERIPLGGVTNTLLHVETDGTMHVEERQDVQPIMEYAHAARNYRFNAESCDGMMRHEAEIPFVVFQEACKLKGIVPSLGSKEANVVIEEILRDPTFATYRCAPTQRDPRIVIKGVR